MLLRNQALDSSGKWIPEVKARCQKMPKARFALIQLGNGTSGSPTGLGRLTRESSPLWNLAQSCSEGLVLHWVKEEIEL